MMNRDDEANEDEFENEVAWEVTDVLDLHSFRPRDVHDLVLDYVEEARKRGFPAVRIIHGKGVGTLRRIVHGALEASTHVASFGLADPVAGGWGATLVTIKQGGGEPQS